MPCVQITPTDDECRSLAGFLEKPGNRLGDLSTPEQYLQVLGQVSVAFVAV